MANITAQIGIVEPEQFGIKVKQNGIAWDSINILAIIYSFSSLRQISVYHITFELQAVNTQTTRTTYGMSKVGCYYDQWDCDPSNPNITSSNTSFTTERTYVQTFYEQLYFYGMSQFIVDLNQTCSIPIPIDQFNLTSLQDNVTQLCFSFYFDTFGTTLNGQSYKTKVNFTGNQYQLFSMEFSYFIDISFMCPGTVDIYYQQNMVQCDTQCNQNDGQYPNNTDFQCYDCGSLCKRCTGPIQGQCTDCFTGIQFRVLEIDSCICRDNYYEDGSNVCPKCHVSCQTCFGPGTSMCLTCQPLNLRYNDGSNSCPCLDGYYHNEAPICDDCHYSCQSCSDKESNTCITCNSTYHRTINSTTSQCLCNNRYFENNVKGCQLCHYSCVTCTTQLQCENTCNNTAHRTYEWATKECICQDGYYDDGSNQQCLICHTTCERCDGPSRSDCLSCDIAEFFALNVSSGQCSCIEHYFQFNLLCHQCHYSCRNCTDANRNNCSVCDQTNFHRKLDSALNECYCIDNYYDDYLNDVEQCAGCNFKCLTCQLTAEKCLTCDPSLNRVLTGTNCQCKYGYIQIVNVCKICHYSCETCSSDTLNTCLSCNTTVRDKIGGQCKCKTHMYDDGIQEQCKSCHIKCSQCIGPDQDQCILCSTALLRETPTSIPNYCPCKISYYDTVSAICQQCDEICLRCSVSPTNCTQCDGLIKFREIDGNTCKCLEHYYQESGPICNQCSSECLTCYINADNCTSCPILRTISFGVVVGIDRNKCLCINDYFEDLGTGICQQCDPICETCVLSANICLICSPGLYRQNDGGDCVCEYGYYDDTVNLECQQCPYYCLNCTASALCLQCSGSFRSLTNNCNCIDGYYNYGSNPICQKCADTCLTCSSQSICLSCYLALQHRIFSVDQCKCQIGYFQETPKNQICGNCHYSCQTCNGPSDADCIICGPSRTQNPILFKCPCTIGYYEQPLDNLCYLCDPVCKQCSISAGNCTNCYTGMSLLNNQCICPEHYYYQGSGVTCQPCHITCSQCQNTPENCLECYLVQQATYLSGFDCVCFDNFYWNTTVNKCVLCHSTCRTCSGSQKTQCTACFETTQFRTLSGTNTCLCNPGYYQMSDSTCSRCNLGCTSCYNGSQYECTGCSVGYTLIGSYCRKQITCLNYIYQGSCVNICPTFTYPSISIPNKCEKCLQPCLTCVSSTKCNSCIPQTYYQQLTFKCLWFCPSGHYINQNGACVSCPINCTQCQYSIYHFQAICTKCKTTFIIVDAIRCLKDCPLLTHIMDLVLNMCIKCLGNCLTCTALDVKQCLSCIQSTNYLNGQCFKQCPIGYYESENKCQVCEEQCAACFMGQCLACSQDYYLPPNSIQCIRVGYFINQFDQLTNCHFNCLTCTNSSFSSCLLCSLDRGNYKTHKSISGYCPCLPPAIDIGQGICDTEKYNQVSIANQILVSGTYSTIFMASLAAIVANNYLLMFSFLNYMQTYSGFYYLNGTTSVMSTDMALESYRIINFVTWVHEYQYEQEKQNLTNLTRIRNLIEESQEQIIQSNQSLFLRGYSFKYLTESANIFFWLTIIIWFITLCLYLTLRCCLKRKKKIQKVINIQHQTEQFSIDNLQFSDRYPISKKLIKFYGIYHESVAIILHLCISTQLTLVASISFKILLTNSYQINYTQLILSIIFSIYLIGYTIRLLILLALRNSKQLSNSNLSVLVSLHLRHKNHPLHQIYLPMIILRNQISMILIVALSENYSKQIIASGIVYLIFTLYSVFACPYPNIMRIFLHFQQLFFLGQIIALIISLNSVFQDYVAAWILLALNYIQIFIFLLFTISILVYLGRKKLCYNNSIINDQKQNHSGYQHSIQSKKQSKLEHQQSFAALKQAAQIDGLADRVIFDTEENMKPDNFDSNNISQPDYPGNSDQREIQDLDSVDKNPSLQVRTSPLDIILKKYRVIRKNQPSQNSAEDGLQKIQK